jgi:hypothetical protein
MIEIESARHKSPSPPFRGEREGPDAQRREGEAGYTGNWFSRPPHPTLSLRPAGGEERQPSLLPSRL